MGQPTAWSLGKFGYSRVSRCHISDNSSLGFREWLCLTRPSADVLPFCPPSGSRIQETRTRGVSFSRFGLGTPRFTQLDLVITEFFLHHPETAVRFHVPQSRSNLIYKTIGMVESLANLLAIHGLIIHRTGVSSVAGSSVGCRKFPVVPTYLQLESCVHSRGRIGESGSQPL